MRKITGGLCLVLISLFLFSCQKEASYEVGAPGKGSLQSDQGECLPKLVGGTFRVAKALADTNFIEVTVNVQQTGSYLIKTDTVNGYFFRGSGSFSATGLRTVRLAGSGTPLVEGTNNFIVRYDTSFCGVAVTVLPTTGGGTSVNDHFPLTQNSWWSYNDFDQSAASTDTMKRKVNGTATFAGNTYQVFEETYSVGGQGEYYFRKAGNDYFEYTIADYYALADFDNDEEVAFPFLKENLTTGQTWSSPEYSGTVSNVPKKLKYVFTCTDANGTATLNGNNFSNVYKITFKSQVATGNGAFTDEGLVWTMWFARNVGLIHMSATYLTLSITSNIRYYQVL